MPYFFHPDGFAALVCPLCGAVIPDQADTPQAWLGGDAIGPVCFGHAGTFTERGWFIIEEELDILA